MSIPFALILSNNKIKDFTCDKNMFVILFVGATTMRTHPDCEIADYCSTQF